MLLVSHGGSNDNTTVLVRQWKWIVLMTIRISSHEHSHNRHQVPMLLYMQIFSCFCHAWLLMM